MRRMRELFQQIFVLGIFWGQGGVSRYATTPLIVALSLGHSDITRFGPLSPTAIGYHLNCAEKSPKVAQTTGTVDIQAFWDPLQGELLHVQIFMNDDPHLLT